MRRPFVAIATVELGEPLGDPRLVDGSCRTTDVGETVFCDSKLR